MDLKDIDEKLSRKQSIEDRLGFNPYYPRIESGLSDPILIEGREYINLASNNYLGLATDIRIKEAVIEAVEKYGASLCGTPVATGGIDLYKRAEEKLAAFVGLEASILLPSCYQANNGFFTALAKKEDLILVDRLAHSSLIQGSMAVGCKVRPFLHNNMDHLSEILKKSTAYDRIFVVTESVFSTHGSIAPLKIICQLCKDYHAIPVVDDSHGIGVIGKNGRGILEEEGIHGYPGIYTASLGKALANFGGMIAGDKKTMEYLRYYCPHLVYSTALPPSVLGGILKALEIVETEFSSIGKRMWHYKDLIHQAFIEAGFEVASGRAPINAIVTKTTENTIDLTKTLYDHGILSTAFVEPSVPSDEGVVRLIAGANLRESTMEKVLELIKRIGRR